MKNNKKGILSFGIILTIFVISIYFANNKKEVSRENITELSEIKSDILASKIEHYDETKLKNTKIKVLNILNSETDDITLAECNFILGNIYMQSNNNIDAIECFNKSINYFDEINEIKLKTKTYFELSSAYLNESQFTKSQAAFNKLKEVSTIENKKEEIVKYSVLRANHMSTYPQYRKRALEILEDTLKLAEEINYSEIEDVHMALGHIYWYENRLVESIHSKLEALSLVRGKNIQNKMARISIDIGVDYLYFGNYDESLTYLLRVLSSKLDDENESSIIKGYALLNLIECYIKLGDYDSAKESIKILDENIINIKDRKNKEDLIIISYINKADLQTELGNPLEAIKLLEWASYRNKKGNEFNFYNFEMKLWEEYGDAYYELKDYKNALKYHKKSEKLAIQKNLSYLEVIYNEKIYLDYKNIGDYKNTILYLERNAQLKTKLLNDKNREYFQYLINEFESENNLKKISLLEESQNRMLILFIVLATTIIIISLFLYFIYNQNKEINRLNKLFKDLSETDELTKVNNRRALEEFLSGNWALYKKTEMPISFMMVDLDFYKLYNDNYGHPKGDKVLAIVAREIKNSCRNVDFVARYGGEEFIVIMLNSGKDEAVNIAERIIENIYNLNIKHEYSKISDRISISIGITTANIGTNQNYDEYIQKSDKALYEAKSKGRNTYVYLN